MADDPQRPPPGSVVQIASDVVAGLKAQPLMLGLMVLNVVGIGAAIYVLLQFLRVSEARMNLILKACLPNLGDG